MNAQIIAKGNHIFVSINKFCIGYFVRVTLETGFSCNSQSIAISPRFSPAIESRITLHPDPLRRDRASGERKPDYFHTCITMFDDYTTFDARIPFVPFTGVFLG